MKENELLERYSESELSAYICGFEKAESYLTDDFIVQLTEYLKSHNLSRKNRNDLIEIVQFGIRAIQNKNYEYMLSVGCSDRFDPNLKILKEEDL